jgi:hypothetical protein
MNSEDVKSALDRRRAHAAACDGGSPDESPYYDDTGMMGKDAELLADAYLVSPQWRDKPTCAGLWYFPHRNRCFIVLAGEANWPRHADTCFGPIPESPA